MPLLQVPEHDVDVRVLEGLQGPLDRPQPARKTWEQFLLPQLQRLPGSVLDLAQNNPAAHSPLFGLEIGAHDFECPLEGRESILPPAFGGQTELRWVHIESHVAEMGRPKGAKREGSPRLGEHAASLHYHRAVVKRRGPVQAQQLEGRP